MPIPKAELIINNGGQEKILHAGVQTEGYRWSQQGKKDCKDLNIAPSTLSTFLKGEKQTLTVKETQKFHSKMKKMRRANNDDLDKAMFLWFKQAHAMGTPISGP